MGEGERTGNNTGAAATQRRPKTTFVGFRCPDKLLDKVEDHRRQLEAHNHTGKPYSQTDALVDLLAIAIRGLEALADMDKQQQAKLGHIRKQVEDALTVENLEALDPEQLDHFVAAGFDIIRARQRSLLNGGKDTVHIHHFNDGTKRNQLRSTAR